MGGDQGIQWEIEAFKIGNKIKELREKNRYTLQDLAAKTGLPKEFLAEIEKAEVVPPIANLLKLSKALMLACLISSRTGPGKKRSPSPAVTKGSAWKDCRLT